MNIIKPMKTIASISTVCAMLAFASVSNANITDDNAGTNSHKHHQKSKHMMKKMAKYLSLSEQQKTEIKAIRTQAKEQGEPLRAQMKQFKEAEKLLLQAETFDDEAFVALHASYQQIFAQESLAKAKTKNAIFNVLTSEQQEKWLSKMEKRKVKMKRKNKSEKTEELVNSNVAS
jgi:Spy/CpxP family protein refolding chaperone